MNQYDMSPANAPLLTEKLVMERKLFYLDLKENHRGRFLKITEDVGGRRDTILMPAAGLPELVAALNRIIDFDQNTRELEGQTTQA